MARTSADTTSSIVTPAGLPDAAALAAFARRTFVDAYAANNVPQHVSDYVEDAFAPERIRADLARDDVVYLIARIAGSADALCGYTKLCTDSTIPCVDDVQAAQIERVYVDPAAQGSGLGGRLLEATVEFAGSRGAAVAWLAVWEENRAAQRFYARHGFDVVGSTHFMLGPERQQDVVMARRL